MTLGRRVKMPVSRSIEAFNLIALHQGLCIVASTDKRWKK